MNWIEWIKSYSQYRLLIMKCIWIMTIDFFILVSSFRSIFLDYNVNTIIIDNEKNDNQNDQDFFSNGSIMMIINRSIDRSIVRLKTKIFPCVCVFFKPNKEWEKIQMSYSICETLTKKKKKTYDIGVSNIVW